MQKPTEAETMGVVRTKKNLNKHIVFNSFNFSLTFDVVGLI
jgi:hypothetical protein